MNSESEGTCSLKCTFLNKMKTLLTDNKYMQKCYLLIFFCYHYLIDLGKHNNNNVIRIKLLHFLLIHLNTNMVNDCAKFGGHAPKNWIDQKSFLIN